MASDAPADADVDYRGLLEVERGDLRAQLAELGFGEEGALKYDSNFADTSQVTAERGEAEALAGQLRDALAEVEAAIERLEKGTYGHCERCGQPIAPARLEAKPAARRCIACASKP
ncbi:MAG TPA: TraR/DksA C4-type zinc finger protein [Acidimicrobiales bacterium]|nr:TraR/DksA C4-type zinc finger protein [Acidimicrobiales bacterium]